MAITILDEKDKVELQEDINKKIGVVTESIDNTIDNAIDSVVIDGRTLAVEDKFVSVKQNATKTTGKFYNYADGNIYDGSAYNYYTLNVSAGEKYRVYGYTLGTIKTVSIHKENGEIISYYPTENYNGTMRECIFDIPEDASYIIVHERPSFAEAAIEKTKNSHHFVSINDYLYGKKLVACGDSITAATNPEGGTFKNYAQCVAERHNMSCFVDGRSGSTMTNISDGKSFSETRYMNLPEFDYLTIWFGWNDAAYAQVGTIEDTTDTTFYGAYKKVLEHIITNNPTKKIGLIVPYLWNGVEPFAQAVRDISALYGVPCLDLKDYNKCSCIAGWGNDIQKARKAAMTYDGTHPNQIGHEFISTMYEQFLLSL